MTRARIGPAIGIDPGVRHLGYALAYDGRILAAACSSGDGSCLADLALQHSRLIPRGAFAHAIVYLESMTACAGRATTAQDLIDVQTVGCLTAAALNPGAIVLLTPSEWKGSTPKPIHHERMIAALDPGERAILRNALNSTPKKNHKEILDAVGILLYGLERIERTGARRKQ